MFGGRGGGGGLQQDVCGGGVMGSRKSDHVCVCGGG